MPASAWAFSMVVSQVRLLLCDQVVARGVRTIIIAPGAEAHPEQACCYQLSASCRTSTMLAHIHAYCFVSRR
jgi:hypothetical protein